MSQAGNDTEFEDLDGSIDTGTDKPKAAAEAENFDDFTDLAQGFPAEFDDMPGAIPGSETAVAAGDDPLPGAVVEEIEDEDAQWSEKTKRRIERERRLTRRAQDSADATAAELQTLKARMEALESQPRGASATGEPPAQTELKAKLQAAKDKRKDAKREGDLDAEDAADEEVRDFDFKRRLIEAAIEQQRANAKQGGVQQQNHQQDPNPGAKPAAATPGGAPNMHADTKAWLERNSTWYGKPGFEDATAKAKAADTALYQAGFEVGDADYFTELDRRLKKEGVQKPGAAAGRGSPVAPANAGGGQGGESRGARTQRLSADDVSTMRAVKLDPQNKAHVQAFLQEKRSARSSA